MPAQPPAGAGEPLTHLDARGQARMVDVSPKPATLREAVAEGAVYMRPETLQAIVAGGVPKGDVLAAARIAGIQAAKRTWELIPLCHPIPLQAVQVELEPDPQASCVRITATVRAVWVTGVEMEALAAVCVAALTVYDMGKALDRGMRIGDIQLVRKAGGRSGTWERRAGS
ncbi:MAG TPA: cyclic pyranopterin monophosphate synthase MoaC [Limnochordales bacterium]